MNTEKKITKKTAKNMNLSAASINKPIEDVEIANIEELDNSKRVEINTTKGAIHRSNLLLDDKYNTKLNLYCALYGVKKQDVGFKAMKAFLDAQNLPDIKL